jgi:hypothetical protein
LSERNLYRNNLSDKDYDAVSSSLSTRDSSFRLMSKISPLRASSRLSGFLNPACISARNSMTASSMSRQLLAWLIDALKRSGYTGLRVVFDFVRQLCCSVIAAHGPLSADLPTVSTALAIATARDHAATAQKA